MASLPALPRRPVLSVARAARQPGRGRLRGVRDHDRRGVAARLAATNQGLYQFLLNKWYFDELYDLIFVRPAFWVGNALWKGFDDWLVDQTIVEGLGARVKDVTNRVVRLQSGYLYTYAFVMLIGVAALLTWVMVNGGHV